MTDIKVETSNGISVFGQENTENLHIHNRVDFDIIASLVRPGTRVLDVGCSDGELLQLLRDTRKVDGRGVELSQSGVNQCLMRGLSVIQGDADRDLVYYPDSSFDYVILSQTLQATLNPKKVLSELLRIGERAIVSIPNFGYWRVRGSLMFRGRMPVTKEVGATVEDAVALNRNGERMLFSLPWGMWNLLGQQAVFLLKR